MNGDARWATGLTIAGNGDSLLSATHPDNLRMFIYCEDYRHVFEHPPLWPSLRAELRNVRPEVAFLPLCHRIDGRPLWVYQND